MAALAMARGVTVVATYTDGPPLPGGSSGVCRYPLTLPSLDITKVGMVVEELNLEYPGKVLSVEDERLLATLKFRLGFVLTTKLRKVSVIHRRYAEGDEEVVFLKQFKDAGKY